MLTSKERSKLRAIANQTETIFQVGKGGVGEELIKQLNDVLHVREIIKIKVLENAPSFVKEVAEEIATKTNADVVQVIGTKFVLYKKNKKDPKIIL